MGIRALEKWPVVSGPCLQVVSVSAASFVEAGEAQGCSVTFPESAGW